MADAPSHRFPAADLRAFTASAFIAVGVPVTDAQTIARVMIGIDLRGGEGHGIFRLAQYIRRIRAGGINVTPEIRVAHDAPATAVVDGDNCIGHLAVSRAAGIAIEKASACGIGWVGTRNSNHAGAASAYAMMPLAHDMIGLYAAVGSANHLPPWGGIDMLLSTNPIAVAIPTAQEPPVVLDMATTVAAYGKVKTAAQRGQTMPEGWMIDRQGQPLTDPARADEGFLLPIGGYKGYGLALILGLLAGTLNGAALGQEVVDFNRDDTTPTNTGQFIAAIDVSRFGDLDRFKREADRVVREMRGSDLMPGFDRIQVPGEGSHAEMARRERDGIPLPGELMEVLNDLARDLEIPQLS